MNTFLDNAQQLFDVARADDRAEDLDFALLIRADGGVHMIMESQTPLDTGTAYAEAHTAYRVTRSRSGVRVEGKSAAQKCLLEDRGRLPAHRMFLRDQVLYSMTSPLLNSAPS